MSRIASLSNKSNYITLIGAALASICCSLFFVFAHPNLGLGLALFPVFVSISFALASHRNKLLYAIVIYSFFAAYIGRIYPSLPVGVITDLLSLILLTIIIFSLKDLLTEERLRLNVIVIAMLAWLVLTILELLNPYATEHIAWITASRSIGIYPIIFTLFSILLFYKSKNGIQIFINTWAILTMLCSFWGLKQSYFGLNDIEHAWMNNGAFNTHILNGKLRCFSILSDAAQFGASQAHAAFVFGLFGITSSISQPKRYFYLTTAVFAFLGLLVSGTRGAFFILIAGFSVYTLLSGRWKILVVGIITLATIYAFLNYTNIGDSFYAMRRLRTAFNTEDPSLLIRLERIESLKVFMADKPFGFGIGTSGLVGQKYYPNGPEILKWTDGHYINIWMQMGIFGLVSKLLVYLSIVIFSCIRILKMRLSNNRNIATILLCGFCGFIVSDFTNDHTTQLPTSIILPITLGIISLLTRKDNKKESEYFIEK